MSYAVVTKSFGEIPPYVSADPEPEVQEETTTLPDFEPDPIAWEENTAQSIPEQEAQAKPASSGGGSRQTQVVASQPTSSKTGIALAGLVVVGVVGYLWLS